MLHHEKEASHENVSDTSPCHLTRLFLEYGQIAPLQYLRRIRLAVVQTALASGDSVTAAAAAAGFSSDTQLRRAWQHCAVPDTPSRPAPRACAGVCGAPKL